MILTLAAITNVSYGTTLFAFSVLLGEDADAGEFDCALLSRGTKELRTMFRTLNDATLTPSRASQRQRPATSRAPFTACPLRPFARHAPRALSRHKNGLTPQGLAAVRPLTEKPEDYPYARPQDELGTQRREPEVP